MEFFVNGEPTPPLTLDERNGCLTIARVSKPWFEEVSLLLEAKR